MLTEALRGAGSYLRRSDNTTASCRISPPAPNWRCEISSPGQSDHEMKRLGANCMYLDISHRPEAFIRQPFPIIYDKLLTREIDEYYSNFCIYNNLLEVRNLVLVHMAELIVKSALLRKESRGLHFTIDYPVMQPDPQSTILQP